MANIKQIKLDTVHDIEALHFITGSLDTPAQWKSYIDSIAQVGLKIEVLSELPEASETTYNTYKSSIVLIPETGVISGTYVEYVILDKGASADPRYAWEKIGSTQTDLNAYAKKTEAGKAGTYTSTEAGAGSTGEAGAATITTSNVAAAVAAGTATITYKLAGTTTSGAGGATITSSSAGAGEDANTGNAGGATVNFSNASFAGTEKTVTVTGNAVVLNDHSFQPAGTISKPGITLTKTATTVTTEGVKAVASTFTGTTATISISGTVSGTSVGDHVAQELTASGSQAIAAHSHTINCAKETTTVVTDTATATGSTGAHEHTVDSHTHAAAQTVLTSESSFTANGNDTFTQGSLPVLTVTNKTVPTTTLTETFTVVTGVTAASASGTTTVNTGYTHTDPTFGSTNVVTGYPNFSGGSLTGTKVFNTDAIKAATLSASTTSTDGPAYVESVTHTAASLTGTVTFNTNAIKSISGTKNYGFSASTTVLTGATVNSDGVLSLTTATAGTQDAHTGDAASTGTVGISGGSISATTKYMKVSTTAASTASVGFTAAALGTASTVAAYTSVSKAGGITSSGTASVVTGVTGGTASGTATFAPETIGSASDWSAGTLPTFTQGSKASFTAKTASVAGTANNATLTTSNTGAHTHSIAAATTSSITYVTSATSSEAGAATVSGANFKVTVPKLTHSVTEGSFSGSTKYQPEGTISNTYTAAGTTSINNVTAAALDAAPTFTGTTATITHSVSASTNTVSMSGTFTPEGTLSGSQTIAAHSHSYVKPVAHTHSVTLTDHTHSVTLTDATVTGTAAVDVAAHSHTVTITSHTHTIGNHTHSTTVSSCA